MRDLGEMGENSFSLLSADGGLVANGSKIDKTGWDFYVEFPYDNYDQLSIEHSPAIECKVQVKATDNLNKKVQIKLSNLRRLITTNLPTFLFFIEFDGKTNAQRAYIIHIDNNMIYKILKRIREIDLSDSENKFNKKKMTIHYNNSHQLSELTGNCLKNSIKNHIGNNFAKYQKEKLKYLENVGYENGYNSISFETLGEENLKDLIDVSLGLKEDVNVSLTKAYNTRFGIQSNKPFIEPQEIMLSMPDIKPNAIVIVNFKESNLDPGIELVSNMFISPLNKLLPDNLKKIRLEMDFLDITFLPYIGKFNYNFSLEDNNPVEIKHFIKLLTILKKLKSSGKNLIMDIENKEELKLGFDIPCQNDNFLLTEELHLLEVVEKIITYFGLREELVISLLDLRRYKDNIYHIERLLNSDNGIYRLTFDADLIDFDLDQEIACISLMSSPLGSHAFGFILTLFGTVIKNTDNSFEMHTTNYKIEKKLVRSLKTKIKNEDVLKEIEIVESKYIDNFQVVTLWDK